MKKLSLILALVLCFAVVLAACNDTTDESGAESTAESKVESTTESKVESTVVSEDASEDASEEASEDESEDESSEPEDESSEDAPAQGEKPNELKGSNVALNKTYTGADVAITSGDGTTCGYTANLTDGQAASVGSYDGAWFAFWYNKDSALVSNNAPNGIATVVIDLGAVTDGINAIRVNCYNANTSGILPANSITAYVSADGSSYETIGTLVLPETDDPAWAEIAVDNASAQYVKLVFEIPGTWCFINEIEVYAE